MNKLLRTSRRISRQGGFTLIEGMVAATLLCLVLIATIALFTSMCRLWRVGSSGTSANSYGSLAMRKLVTEIQEGQGASIQSGRLVIQYPYYDAGSGAYQKAVAGSTVAYYLSGDNGTEAPSADGSNSLWRESNGSRTRLARHLKSFQFSMTGDKLVSIIIRGADIEGVRMDPDLIRQSVRLRNY